MTQRGDAQGLTVDQILGIKSFGGAEAPTWSPDGDEIAFASTLGGAPELWSVSPDGGQLRRLTLGMGGVGHLASFMPKWSPTGEYIAYVSAKTGGDEVWLWPVDGSPDVQLTRLGARVEAVSWSPDGREILLASNAFGTFDIFRVKVPGGETVRLTQDRRYEVYPSFTPDGRILYVRLNESWTNHDVILVNGNGSNVQVVLQDYDFFDYHYGRTFGYPKVSPDGELFLFRSHRSGWINVWAAPVAGGDAWQIAGAEADQADAVWSPDGRSIAYVQNHNGTLDLRIVNRDGGEPRVLVAPKTGVCTGPAWSPDGKRIAYQLGTPTSPNDLWVVEAGSGKTRQLTHSLPGGRLAERLIVPDNISYPSFDGLQIHAYLYRPLDRSRKYPGILWIHGGPTSQFMDTFQPQVQFFVQAGYVVLLPNIRGSSGYGREFEDLNNRDWGHGDLKDVIAGAEYLKTLEDVDAGAIGITGTSYGGIMSMAATAFAPPGTFQAAISCSGYADFLHMHGEQELRHIKLLEYELGDPVEDAEVYRRCSAIFQAHQATVPCFVLHGEGKYPGSSASRDFALVLEANYKPFWYKAYEGETYYVGGTVNVKEMLRDMKGFFDLYLKGIAYNRLDDGRRPLTHLSGAGSGGRSPGVQRGVAGEFKETPPKDVAN